MMTAAAAVATFPVIVTVDEVVDLLRWCADGADIREQRRKVYDLVRTGQLTPVGGLPDRQRLTKTLRFTDVEVRRYINGDTP